jgi:hypothetical protein
MCLLWRAVDTINTEHRVAAYRIGTHALTHLVHAAEYQTAFQKADVLQNIAAVEGTFGT